MFYKANIYVLGLIEYDKEEIVLKEEQLKQINKKIEEILENNHILKSSNNEISKPNTPFKVWDINISKIKLKKDKTRNILLESARLGYYHHRIIFNISMKFNKESFHDLRYIRDEVHEFFRNYIIKDLSYFSIHKVDASSQDCRIRFVYSYLLLVIENGTKFMSKGDTIFSDATTSFFFKIPESTFIPRNHYVRVSIPGTVLYCEGKIRNDFFWNLIDAIYSGGLYEKKKNERHFNFFHRKNDFDEYLLINLTRVMLEYVSEIQYSVTGINLSILATIIAVLAILISLIAK